MENTRLQNYHYIKPWKIQDYRIIIILNHGIYKNYRVTSILNHGAYKITELSVYTMENTRLQNYHYIKPLRIQDYRIKIM